MSDNLKIIVSGLVGLYPLGGVAWDYFQYVTGLARLGHDVYYHEDTWSWPYDPIENQNTMKADYSVKFIKEFFNTYAPDLQNKWHYVHLHDQSFGMTRSQFNSVAESADLFINVSGDCFIPDKLSGQCIKIFVDTDPGYNQIMLQEKLPWSENVERWCQIVSSHDLHFTNAENINGPDCLVPTTGYSWKETGRPIDLSLWPKLVPSPKRCSNPWTTVLTWNAFKGPLLFNGVEFQSKGAEFEKVVELPEKTNVPFKIALGGSGAPIQWLQRYGWEVVNAPTATLSPACYKELIRNSRGEFSTAKHVYVAMRTGWFSYRSACYLAACRPVVVQDTGFKDILPVGRGIVVFNDIDEAVEAIEEVEGNYDLHVQAARAIAQEHFNSDKILGKLLEDSLVP